jgi:ABC-2 type transport system ATP-binding protein
MFSGGQAQRVMVARALMHAPDVLFLDEPTTGLDPAARLFVWDRVRDLKARGVTIVLTTHDMDEATELADRVGIMDHGKLLALDTPAALTRGLPGRTTLEVAVVLNGTPPDDLLRELGALGGVERVEQVASAGPPGGWPPMGGPVGGAMGGAMGGGGPPGGPPDGPPSGPAAAVARRELRARLYLAGDAPQLVAPVAAVVANHDAHLTDVATGAPSLEDVFIALTGRALR